MMIRGSPAIAGQRDARDRERERRKHRDARDPATLSNDSFHYATDTRRTP